MSSKIVIAGGFGAGKTTLVRSVSEIPPVTTEAIMTEASVGHDDTSVTPDKTTTTVAMDFGRITIDDELVMYMFGTPGQARFWFMWDDLVRGAVGAVVVVDYFETNKRIPYIVALNKFEGHLDYTAEQVREALEVSPEVPIIDFDARHRMSGGDVLKTLLRYALEHNRASEPVA
ncbi:GTP-binding protein [Nocardiopsis prasina]|uniref:GTP-binding protein n=1 Tax=Nocardiopsis prasina TaxID=2015 RepID=UPI0003829D64|nr:ATP/GTP-binding protein [Nocardiopsis prasina]